MTSFWELSEDERRERSKDRALKLRAELAAIVADRRADGQPVSVQMLIELLVDRQLACYSMPAALSDDARDWLAMILREYCSQVAWEYADEHPDVMTAAELQERAAYHDAEANALRDDSDALLAYARERAKQEGVELPRLDEPQQ
jgi:hypothetical protein